MHRVVPDYARTVRVNTVVPSRRDQRGKAQKERYGILPPTVGSERSPVGLSLKLPTYNRLALAVRYQTHRRNYDSVLLSRLVRRAQSP
jgi:hypothetical protein